MKCVLKTISKNILNTKNYEINGYYHESRDGKEVLCGFNTILKNDLKALFESFQIALEDNAITYTNSKNEIIKINDHSLTSHETEIEEIILVSNKEKNFLTKILWYFEENGIFYNYEKDVDDYNDLVKETEKNLKKIENILNCNEKRDPDFRSEEEIQSILDNNETFTKNS